MSQTFKVSQTSGEEGDSEGEQGGQEVSRRSGRISKPTQFPDYVVYHATHEQVTVAFNISRSNGMCRSSEVKRSHE